jgi:hypothetical protein
VSATALAPASAEDHDTTVEEETLPADGLLAVYRRLVALCRERGPLRGALSRIAARLVVDRAWERLGYARLGDYAAERLGLSARWVRCLALAGHAFGWFPGLEDALVSGALGWTKVRLLAALPFREGDQGWIERAAGVTADELSRMIRAVDRGRLEAGVLEVEQPRSRRFEVRCTPEVRWKWYAARGAAARVAGRLLHAGDAAELILAEILSAVPVDEEWQRDACDAGNASWEGDAVHSREDTAPRAFPARVPTRPDYGDLEPLVAGLDTADAFELDDRLRRGLSLEQRLDARLGPLLVRSGAAGCTAPWAMRRARPTRATAWGWIPRAPAPRPSRAGRRAQFPLRPRVPQRRAELGEGGPARPSRAGGPARPLHGGLGGLGAARDRAPAPRGRGVGGHARGHGSRHLPLDRRAPRRSRHG